jgi:hypothetical protein
MEQAHDLGEARPGHVRQAGHFGLVSYLAAVDQTIEPDG